MPRSCAAKSPKRLGKLAEPGGTRGTKWTGLSGRAYAPSTPTVGTEVTYRAGPHGYCRGPFGKMRMGRPLS